MLVPTLDFCGLSEIVIDLRAPGDHDEVPTLLFESTLSPPGFPERLIMRMMKRYVHTRQQSRLSS